MDTQKINLTASFSYDDDTGRQEVEDGVKAFVSNAQTLDTDIAPTAIYRDKVQGPNFQSFTKEVMDGGRVWQKAPFLYKGATHMAILSGNHNVLNKTITLTYVQARR